MNKTINYDEAPDWATHYGKSGDVLVWLNEHNYSYDYAVERVYEFGHHGTRSRSEIHDVVALSTKDTKPEDSGGSCDYYKVFIENPTTASNWDEGTENPQYWAECNDIIEALDMTYAEANMFKEIWRSAAARTLGKLKAGHSEVRGAEKIIFFAQRNAIHKGVNK